MKGKILLAKMVNARIDYLGFFVAPFRNSSGGKPHIVIFKDYPDVLNIKQLCLALGVGKNTAYQLIKNGDLKSIRIGKVHKIPKIWLIEYVLGEAS